MNFLTASPYLEKMVVQKNENDGVMSVSGGLPLKIFSEYYSPKHETTQQLNHPGEFSGGSYDVSTDSFIKIGGLSVPIGLVLSSENDKKINIKYSNNSNKIEKEIEGGSLEEQEYLLDNNDTEFTNAIKPSHSGGVHNIEEIEYMDNTKFDNMLNMVCNLREKQNTRKKK